MPASKEHWEKVYTERKPDEVSWFQEEPQRSLELIAKAALDRKAPIIDVGGGASLLVDRLNALGYEDVSVLDISAKALGYAKERLHAKASRIHWLEADATAFDPPQAYALWHDRAVFHFLTDPTDRAKYLAALNKGLRLGGTLILAAFAPDGPEKCSGLPVRRYDQASLSAELGPAFQWVESVPEIHRTPWQTEQSFLYSRFIKTA